MSKILLIFLSKQIHVIVSFWTWTPFLFVINNYVVEWSIDIDLKNLYEYEFKGMHRKQ